MLNGEDMLRTMLLVYRPVVDEFIKQVILL